MQILPEIPGILVRFRIDFVDFSSGIFNFSVLLLQFLLRNFWSICMIIFGSELALAPVFSCSSLFFFLGAELGLGRFLLPSACRRHRCRSVSKQLFFLQLCPGRLSPQRFGQISSNIPQSQGKNIHHHRGTPHFSICRPSPKSQSKNGYGVYHLLGKTREKGIHERSGKKGIHHRASDSEKKRRDPSVRNPSVCQL